MVGLRTGLRVGELLGLEFGDVDFKRKRIHVVRAVVEGETQTPKSGRERYVPLSPQALGALKEQRVRHPDAARVFPRLETRHQVSALLRRACAQAGIKPRGPHAMRHGFGSAAAGHGVPVRVLQEWMGHSTLTMTERYFKLREGVGDELVGLLDAVAPKSRRSAGGA